MSAWLNEAGRARVEGEASERSAPSRHRVTYFWTSKDAAMRPTALPLSKT